MPQIRELLTSPPADAGETCLESTRDQETLTPNGKPTGEKKQRRQIGHDLIVIAEDFNAPLSPEETEIFGL